jgi:hypothetical protein
MRKFAATVVCALFLCVAATAPIEAGGAPGSDALKTAGDGVAVALMTGTPDELFNRIAPWLRGRAELFKERLPDELEKILEEFPEERRAGFKKELEAAMLADVKTRDPDGALGVESMEDIIGLSAAQMFSLDLRHLQLQADEKLKANRGARWHEVNRAVYTRMERLDWGEADEGEVQRTYGKIGYANRFKDSLVVTCTAEGDNWFVVDFSLRMGDWELALSDSDLMRDPMPEIVAGADNSLEAKRAEGEQLMGSARNQARVEFARKGTAPKALTDSISEEEFEGLFTGRYFKLRASIYKKPDMERGAIVAEPVDDESLGYGALYFNYWDGDSDIEWYESQEDLEEALKNFQSAK